MIANPLVRSFLGRSYGDAEMDRRLRSHENSFDALRLFFALLVLFSHSYPLLGRSDEFFFAVLGYDTGGGIAVAGFFVISGLLVSRSALTSDFRRYAAGRFLRIVPGLFAMSVVCALVIGPLVTSLPLNDYLSRMETWRFLKNAAVFPIKLSLPGVFKDNPMWAVNGSLWTLPIEVAMYVMLPLAVWAGLVSRVGTAFMLCAISIGLYVGMNYFGLSWAGNWGPSLVKNVPLFGLLKFGFFFIAGALLYAYRGVIPASPALALAILVLWGVLHHTTAGLLLWYIGLPYLVFFGFFGAPFGHFFARHGDLSYGVYIYAFPVQQTVVHWFGRSSLDIASLTLLATLGTLVLAYLSWHLVERPAMGLKRWFGARRTSKQSAPAEALKTAD